MPRKKATPKKNVQKRALPKTLAQPRHETEAARKRQFRVDEKRRIVDAVCGVVHPPRPLTDLDYALLPIGKHLDAIRQAVQDACGLRAQTIEALEECVPEGVEQRIAKIVAGHIRGVLSPDDVHVTCDSRVVNGYHIVASDLHRDDGIPVTYHRARVARVEIEFQTVDINGKAHWPRHMTLDAIAAMVGAEDEPTSPSDDDYDGYKHVRAKAQEDLVLNGVASPGVVAQIFNEVLGELSWPPEACEALDIQYERSDDIDTSTF